MRRCLRLWQNAHPLNLSRHPESRVVAGKYKRHFVPRLDYKQRVELGDTLPKLNPYQSFLKAMNETFPAIEKSVEGEILEHYKEHLTPAEQFELEMAWKRRLQVTEETSRKPREYIAPPEPPQPDKIRAIEKVLFLESEEFTDVTMKEVGRYVEIPEPAARVLFKNGLCGRYMTDDFKHHRMFAFMIREETVKLIDSLKMNQTVGGLAHHEAARKENPDFPGALVGLSSHEQLQKLLETDLSTYFLLLNRTATFLNEMLLERGDPELDLVFRNSPDLFEVATNLIVWKYPVQEIYGYVFKDQALDFTKVTLSDLSGILNNGRPQICELLGSFLDFCKRNFTPEDMKVQVSMHKIREYLSKTIELRFGSSSITLDMTGFKQWEDYHPRPELLNKHFPKFSGFNGTTVLSSPSGTGKSNILNAVALWAFTEGNWVVFKVPRATDITRNPSLLVWHPSGLYLQPEVAFDLLADFESCNLDKLADIPVKLDVYGKYNVAGLHDIKDKDYIPLPAQHKWLDNLQVFSDDWRKHYNDDILSEMDRRVKETNLSPRHTRLEYEIGILTEIPVPPDVEKQIDAEVNDDKEYLEREKGEREPEKVEENLKEESFKEIQEALGSDVEIPEPDESEKGAVEDIPMTAQQEDDSQKAPPEDQFSDIEAEELVQANDAAKRYPRKIKNPKSGAETLIFKEKWRDVTPQDLSLHEPEVIDEAAFQDSSDESDLDELLGLKSKGDQKTAQEAEKEGKEDGKKTQKSAVASSSSSSSDSENEDDNGEEKLEADPERFKFADIGAEEDQTAPIATRMAKHLPAPKTLKDIVTFGLTNHAYCTNAICEVLEQLQHMDNYNALILVDEFSEFFKPSAQPSIKYANYKETNSCIPPFDLALGRAFMRLDGHRLKNGTKIVASTEYRNPKKTFDFKKVDILPHYLMKVEPMTLNDFRMMCVFYKSNGFLSEMFSEQDIQIAFMHSQGNWRRAHEILRNYIPIHF